MGGKILIVEFDLFSSVGGGQTVYQNIVRGRPDDTFYYFTGTGEPEPLRPANAIPIFFQNHVQLSDLDVPSEQKHFFYVYRDLLDMAASIHQALGAFTFDVVDTPDYRQDGLFVREAFALYGISIGRVALALHGTLSSAFRFGWPWTDDPKRMFAEMRLREHLQFRAVDCRYSVSQSYADALRRYADLPVNMLDPLAIIREPQIKISEPADHPADLAFLGRRERRKGPDLFVDLAWWIPREQYRKLLLIGDDGLNHQGKGSGPIIDRLARWRGLTPQIIPSMSQSDLRAIYREKTVVCLPSRYDQFNLIALEALLDGCPTVVSRAAGIAPYIEHRIPELSWLLVDVTCDRSAVEPIKRILSDYDAQRAAIAEAVRNARLVPDLDPVQRIYDPASATDQRARKITSDLADRFGLFAVHTNVGPPSSRYRVRIGPRRSRSWLKNLLQEARSRLERSRRAVRSGVAALSHRIFSGRNIKLRIVDEIYHLASTNTVRRNLIERGERSTSERARKLKYLSGKIQDQRVDRVRFFSEMARLERMRGNDLIAATYGLRIIRWLGHDRFQQLAFIKDTLEQHGYMREAEAAEAMYGDPTHEEPASRAILDDQWQRHRTKSLPEPEILDERRGATKPRVSVIVSLYNAAEKLPTFVRMLRQQSMIRSGEAEVVLVDGGSPADEYRVFQALWEQEKLPAVYVRSKERETIQGSWNRGIKLARGDYLAFLGVDEGLRPESLHILAAKLDQNPSVDWVIANSIVTEVDRKGVFDRDIMVYDRTGYRQDWTYLDCTFLSYVGGLYRRNIHDRCGYYDESFRAAGDTEFKNRVLPHIRSKFVPQLLGVFNNYPEGQTTQSPRAEIEDLRAWYLHRTVAGVSYAFDQRPVEDVIALLKDTLGYRKCYTQHISTDLDLAESLAIYLAPRPDGAWQKANALMGEVLGIYQRLELLPNRDSALLDQAALMRDWMKVRALRYKHQRALSLDQLPAYAIFNDNRYEQHWWPWQLG